jgi:hypothetical protein
MRTMMTQPQEWWAGLSQGERHLIWSVMKLLRGAKRSEVEEVARAAAKWESGIGCFIKVRLMGQAAKAKTGRNGQGPKVRLTISCPSAARNQRYAAPGQR